MTNQKLTPGLITLLMITYALFFFTVPISKANSTIPSNFNQKLNLETIYIYNVSSFNTSKPLEWYEVDYSSKVFANTTPGGQIKVNFTGFNDKDPNDFFNLFGNPMPYMNIEFVENRFGLLETNTTFYNVSNGEADMNLLIGYNTFKSVFLLPINNFTYLKEQAYAQDQGPFWNATILIGETNNKITFEFKQTVYGRQKTTSTYDKVSGLLVYTNTSFGNYTLEMTLINLPDLTDNSLIPSYNLSIIIYILCISIPFVILKFNHKINRCKN